ncbi:energy-coupled thiamine transporter ThiT [Salirhabdus sp. Marseille-P4669]|uniref:energy-coupled thiamine transporter ThiT n=1 Tax=Salirhabdus sp. Marseille-P4669 TaxID=2042310 RepID=UPI000C7C8EB2|nr:energy-coupled thiamine transporter ThiT [Salirhabdus sp. Marseille-P4669]
MNNQSKVLFLVEVAIFSALAMLLDLLSGFLTGRFWPNGGSVSIAMVPVMIMAFRWGLKGGLLTGFLFGALQVILGTAYMVHFIQVFVEYFLAFTVVGLAGIVAAQVRSGLAERNGKKWVSYIIIGTIIGSFFRFIVHYIAGIVFWASTAPSGVPVAWFSFTYNGAYMLISCIICAALLLLLMPALPKKYSAHAQVKAI